MHNISDYILPGENIIWQGSNIKHEFKGPCQVVVTNKKVLVCNSELMYAAPLRTITALRTANEYNTFRTYIWVTGIHHIVLDFGSAATLCKDFAKTLLRQIP